MYRPIILELFLIQVIFGFQCQTVCNSENTPRKTYDYYWRDYHGIIPQDAVPGGKDEAGNPTYIGQAYIKDRELLPGTIRSGCRSIQVSAYNKAIQTDRNIKILCSSDISKFAWIPTKNEETHLLTDCHLIVAGSEVGHNLNIGRVNHHGEIVIGKVFSNPLPNRGLWFPYNEKETHFLTYEILTYDCALSRFSNDSQILIEPRAN